MASGRKKLSNGDILTWTVYSPSNVVVRLNGAVIVNHEPCDIASLVATE